MAKWEKAGQPEFVFAHIGPSWIDFVEWGIENSEKPWMTVRSPIHTWGTQWANLEGSLKASNFFHKDKLGQMRGQYETQRMLVKKYPDLYIHKVEGDINELGEYLGLDLPEDSERFSRPTRMKEAIRDKDTKTMNELCGDTDFFTCFRDNLTPDIREFYENLGYDIWWTNG
jgi:hypothetical protein